MNCRSKNKYERGGVRNTRRRGEERRREMCTQEFGGKPKRKKSLEELGVDGSLMLKCMLNKEGGGGVDWMHVSLGQTRGRLLRTLQWNFGFHAMQEVY
jgi:hypothetical protein